LAGGIADEIGEARAIKVIQMTIATTNGFRFARGHTCRRSSSSPGEIPLALTVYNYKAEQLKQKGRSDRVVHHRPAIARPNGIGVARQAPNPHAAVLFHDFEISEEGSRSSSTATSCRPTPRSSRRSQAADEVRRRRMMLD
jgi:iron(III) transport system substrate-binding protein